MSACTLLFCAVVCGILAVTVYGGEYCTIDVTSVTTRTSYCEYGCCGDAYDNTRECCDDPGANSVIYIGGGVGGFVSFVIMCVCIWLCCCKGG